MASEWGTELWDQFDNVDKHHQHEIDFAEKYAKFVKERCAIEQEYATKLRKLCKSYHPKKKGDDRSMFTTHKAFLSQLSELNDLAGQHELVAEGMMTNITKAILNFCNDLKVEKKKLFQDGRQQQAVLDSQERSLEQTKKKFEKEWKECERAQAYFEKLDADINVTKIDVEKAKHSLMSKKDCVESCKTDYGAALETFNKEQKDHYTVHMPKLFQCYKEADERRIMKQREVMIEFAKIDLKVKPILQKCLDGMEQAANAIDAKLDAQLVVEKLKSGFLPPSDKEFEDYTQPQQGRVHVEDGLDSSPRNSVNTGRSANKKGGLSWLFGNKKVQESPDYSHLPPEQRRKKLEKLIDDLKKDINKEDDGRKAIVKMQDVYRANPALGDADSLGGQIKVYTAKIEKLQAELSRLEAWYADATNSVKATPTRSAVSQRTVPEKPAEAKKTTIEVKTEPIAPEPEEKNKSMQRAQSFGDDFDEEPEAIGTCVALYDFEATSEGALSMKAGDKFTVVEADNGDGWTRAMQDDVDGYVPTSYIDVTLFT